MAAIETFPDADDCVIRWSPGAKRLACRSLRRHGLLLLGEVHGVAENPLVIERIVNELPIEVVALEWPRGLELAIDDPARLAAGEAGLGRPAHRLSDAEFAASAAWFGDGRVTAGHFAVLRRISARVAAVDEPLGPPSADVRDTAMAENIESLLRARPGGVLFVAGNLHTRLSAHAHYLPAGARLARDRPALCALDLHYAAGRFWNFGPRTFAPAEPPSHPHVLVDEATEAVVLFR